MEYIPFRPSLYGPFATRFYSAARRLVSLQPDDRIVTDEMEDLIQSEVQWAIDEAHINPHQRRIYRAVWLLLRDLLHVRWQLRWYNEHLQLLPPSYQDKVQSIDEMQAEKDAVRFAMAQSRIIRLVEAKEFIRRVEQPTQGSTATESITVLIADGKALATDIEQIKSRPDDASKLSALRQLIKPYLQLVSEDRCHFTGHKLTDIWRYFRYTWSVPAESTPGRTLHYLVRDAARPYHPIIGIASLENAVIRSPDRDHELGWSTRTIGQKLLGSSDTEAIQVFNHLLQNIDVSISEVDWEGLLTASEIENPTSDVIRRLYGVASRSSSERKAALDEWRQEKLSGETTLQRSEFGNISINAEEALYKAKRATRLYRLLSAKRELQLILHRDDFSDSWRKLVGAISPDGTLENEEFRTVVRTAIRAVKTRHVGTSILELNVCGSIPPYNEILGGKLVALMMLSPQVVADYRNRYGGRASDIASKMKNEPVVRPAEIVFIGTTSLYRVGASQYNRLKLPAGLLRPNAPEVRWNQLGETAGYGTMHIRGDTVQSLQEATSTGGGSYINNVFGEGASPKLRALRHAIGVVLELDQSHSSVELTQHTMSRLIFGAWLATNGRAYLSDETETPEYYFDEEDSVTEQTEKIVDYWRDRWLSKRIHFGPAIERVEEFSAADIILGRELDEIERAEFKPIIDEVVGMDKTDQQSGYEWRDFVRQLYRGTSAYADQMNELSLRMLHVETDLDSAILDAARNGYSVVLTGNPGDGKTHILRILESKLQELPVPPIVEYDASAKTDIDLLDAWQRAVIQERPFCVAINEAVLINMANSHHGAEYEQALRQIIAAQEQVVNAVYYDEEKSLQDEKVVVFDLSRRNVLSKRVVSKVIDALADFDRIPVCGSSVYDDLNLNIRLLQNELVRERLQNILDRVSQRGYHATVRELQSLISYMLFADRDCEQILRESGNFAKAFPQLPFTGNGELFNQMKSVFDPARITHPIWDDLLVTARTEADDWLPEWNENHAEISALFAEDEERFEARKRAFYFFHHRGEELLRMAGTDEDDFIKFIRNASDEEGNRDALRLVVSRINRFFGSHDPRTLFVWQSHRYDQSPRRILYSATKRRANEFELVIPKLVSTMSAGFDLAIDHALFRLRDDPKVRLRIDYDMFELLSQADQGIPVISLESDLTRRLWQFMEQLVQPDLHEKHEVDFQIFDLTTGEQLAIEIDTDQYQYLQIREEK